MSRNMAVGVGSQQKKGKSNCKTMTMVQNASESISDIDMSSLSHATID